MNYTNDLAGCILKNLLCRGLTILLATAGKLLRQYKNVKCWSKILKCYSVVFNKELFSKFTNKYIHTINTLKPCHWRQCSVFNAEYISFINFYYLADEFVYHFACWIDVCFYITNNACTKGTNTSKAIFSKTANCDFRKKQPSYWWG